MGHDTSRYTAAELATYQTLKAAQQVPGSGPAAAEALRAHVNSVGQRMFNDQQAAFAAGTLKSVSQDGA